MKLDQMTYKLEIPEGTTVDIVNGLFSVKGPKGEVKRKFIFPKVKITKEGNTIVFHSIKPTKREKASIYTTEAHLKNMFKGVHVPALYKLKICSGHFPMKVSLKGNVFEVKNFVGETVPRKLTIKPGVDVKVAEPEITVTCCDLELAGSTAAAIEQVARRSSFDKRIFQDGIYITIKNGVPVK